MLMPQRITIASGNLNVSGVVSQVIAGGAGGRQTYGDHWCNQEQSSCLTPCCRDYAPRLSTKDAVLSSDLGHHSLVAFF